MKLEYTIISIFRILKSLDIDFEETLSLVIGKNNSGKTSFLVILQKFLGQSKLDFTCEDLSVDVQKELICLEDSSQTAEEFVEFTISYKPTIGNGLLRFILLLIAIRQAFNFFPALGGIVFGIKSNFWNVTIWMLLARLGKIGST